MQHPPFFPYKILLASQSPRRQMLLKDSGFELECIKIDVEETFPSSLKAEEIPVFLAQKKAAAYTATIHQNELLVTADTVVWLENEVLNKPLTLQEAKAMLMKLSGKWHHVYTGVCVKSQEKSIVFYDESKVFFNALTESQIDYYLQHYRPLDKAGAYGVQEFIGLIGIQKIEGCYYNIMGFPVSKFIHEIEKMNLIPLI